MLISLLGFLVVYACSLSFVYVEGDDASTIAFHVLGRNADVQPPYSPYHGMIDKLLAGFPPNESLLRILALGLSSLATIGFVIVMLSLIFDLLAVDKRLKGLAAFVVLLACPEFFYLGMIYMPSLIAMLFVLASHLLVRRAMQISQDLTANRTRYGFYALSLLLFGLGSTFRWDVALYGFVIVTDLALGNGVRYRRSATKRIVFATAWGTMAIVSSLTMIRFSGYGFMDFAREVLSMQGLVASRTSVSWFTTLGGFQPVFTPAAVVLGTAGFISLIRLQPRLGIVAAVGILPVLPMMLGGVPKMIIPAVPGIMLCVVKGLEIIFFSTLRFRAAMVLKWATALILLGPWIFGIRVYSSDTSWGPGFEVASPATSSKAKNATAIVKGRVDERGISIASFSPTIGGGFAIPTPEGPRPLGGHAAVLLGGGWRRLVREVEQERHNLVQQAILQQRPIVQDNRNALILIALTQMGFTTKDSKVRTVAFGIGERRFFNSAGQELRIIYFNGMDSLREPIQLQQLLGTIGSDSFAFYSSYSSRTKKLKELAPSAVQVLGPFSAMVNASEMQRVIQERVSAK